MTVGLWKHELANIGLAYLWDESDIYRTAYKIREQKILVDVYEVLHLIFLRHQMLFKTAFNWQVLSTVLSLKNLLIAMERNI
jgi:hypothetical protein